MKFSVTAVIHECLHFQSRFTEIKSETNTMNAITVGELYSVPSQTEEGAPIPAAPLRTATSLLEARRGEYCPVGTAEIKAATWEKRIDAPWGTFIRVQVENRLSDAPQVPEIIDAWLRV